MKIHGSINELNADLRSIGNLKWRYIPCGLVARIPGNALAFAPGTKIPQDNYDKVLKIGLDIISRSCIAFSDNCTELEKCTYSILQA